MTAMPGRHFLEFSRLQLRRWSSQGINPGFVNAACRARRQTVQFATAVAPAAPPGIGHGPPTTT